MQNNRKSDVRQDQAGKFHQAKQPTQFCSLLLLLSPNSSDNISQQAMHTGFLKINVAVSL